MSNSDGSDSDDGRDGGGGGGGVTYLERGFFVLVSARGLRETSRFGTRIARSSLCLSAAPKKENILPSSPGAFFYLSLFCFRSLFFPPLRPVSDRSSFTRSVSRGTQVCLSFVSPLSFSCLIDIAVNVLRLLDDKLLSRIMLLAVICIVIVARPLDVIDGYKTRDLIKRCNTIVFFINNSLA